MSKLEKYLDQFPFELTKEEKKEAEKELAELEIQIATDEQEELENPFLEEKVIPIDEIQKRRENRKKTAASEDESIPLYDEVMEAVYPEENEKGTSPRQESDSNEDNPVEERLKIIIDFDKTRILSIRTAKDGSEYHESISNFILTPLYRILDDDDNEKHYVKLDNGYETKHIIFDGETLSINRNFKSFCRQKGDFNWKGNQEDLNQLNDFMIQHRCEVVEEVKYIGYLYDQNFLSEEADEEDEAGNTPLYKEMPEDIWIFPTHAYYNGELYYPDQDNIFRFPTKNVLLEFDRTDNIVKKPIKKIPTKDDVLSVLSGTHELYGHYGWLGIGFMVASLQVSTITQFSRQFPYFYPFGIRNTGKTEFATFMYKFAGVEAVLQSPPQRLDVFRKHLRWYSHLPYGYDEAQQQGEEKKDKDFFFKFAEELKTLFNRKGLQRGDKDPDKLIKFPARAVLTFSGEVATNETAIKSRTIFIDALNFHHDEDTFDDLIEKENIMYWLGQYMMRTAHEWREPFVLNYKNLISEMKDVESYKKITSRVRKNYAIVLAATKTFMKCIDQKFGTVLYTESFFNELKYFALKEMMNSQKEVEEQHQAIVFLSEIASLAKSGELEKNVDYKIDDKILYISPNEAWNAHKKQRFKSPYVSTNAIASDLRAYSFFKGSKVKKIAGKALRCWMFELSDTSIPEFFQHFVEPNLKTYDGPY